MDHTPEHTKEMERERNLKADRDRQDRQGEFEEGRRRGDPFDEERRQGDQGGQFQEGQRRQDSDEGYTKTRR